MFINSVRLCCLTQANLSPIKPGRFTFGRQVLKDLVCKSSLLGDLALKKKVHEHLFKFLENTINSLYNPDAYKDSRIDMVFKEKGFTIRNNILSSDVRQDFNKKNFSDPIHKIFKDIGIF